MGLANALSFNLRQDEAIVSRTIPMIPPEKREEWIIRQARERPGAERAAFLDGACAGDLALRERLGRLLAAQDQPEEVLADGIDAATVEATIKLDLADAPDEAVGQTLGRYKLLEKIGEGGCGVVYMAEQTEPVRRRVALKVIKLGMDTKQVVARFEAERQALAMMDHPNIAKVLDAGATDDGPALLRDGTGARHPHHRLLRPEPISPPRNGSTCSSRSARPSSTRTRRASSTATSSRRTSS